MHAHRPKLARPLTVALAALLLLLAGLGWWLLARNGADKAQWITAPASRGDIEDTTTALGTLQPLNYVDVGTQVSGQLHKVFVEIGDQVQDGQPLGEIDPTVYGSKVAAGEAQLQSLEAQLSEKLAQQKLAEEQFARQDRMLKANATSQDSFQSAQAALRAAQAQVANLRAQMAQIASTLKGDKANLGYTKIYAPMAGTVVSQTTRQGQTVVASQQAPTILRIADLKTMTVWTQVSEADVVKLKVGQDVYFTTLGQPERKRTSTLRQILPTPDVTNNVVLYNALFDVPNPDGDLGIQMSAQVFFVHAQAKDAVLVPISALAMTGRPDTLLVMKDGQPQPRRVSIGVRNRVHAQIVSGLEAGEMVVTARPIAEAAKATGQRSAPPPRL
jgi:RND family efflux transporter, MFP subunit